MCSSRLPRVPQVRQSSALAIADIFLQAVDLKLPPLEYFFLRRFIRKSASELQQQQQQQQQSLLVPNK
jgi:hypothetical protein